MTFDETKRLLSDYVHKEKLTLRLMAEIADIKGSYGALPSVLGNIGRIRGSGDNTAIDRLIEWAASKEKALNKAIDEFFSLQDRLTVAINQLAEVEQNVLIGFYMQNQTNYRLAMELNYSERSIKYIKNRAIHNLSKLL